VSTDAAVNLWGTRIGAVTLDDGARDAVFQYDPDFLRSRIQVAPLTMPLRAAPYVFPGLPAASFHGLPGLVADSLPDRFGNAIIDAWCASQGRRPEDFNAVERLCYTGLRGMGALEFAPARGPKLSPDADVEVDALVRLASEALNHRERFIASLAGPVTEGALTEILRVSTSAGGARAKAVIAYNPATGAVRSGQVATAPGFEHWLIKFDGVEGNRDKELDDPKGYGAIEYAYWLMAREAGVEMEECRLLEENGRRHFMTRRFDRPEGDAKLHMQSLAAIAHFDFNAAGAHSYEQAFDVIRRLGMGTTEVEQMFCRMVFNVVARNQDDHVKNTSFLMDRAGVWTLAPAFDVTYAYAPTGAWTGRHQMSMNGKRDDFTVGDVTECARTARLKGGRGRSILSEVQAAVSRWSDFATVTKVPAAQAEAIARAHRVDMPKS
jgi:serine/threonine-protein kinase HipA